MNRIPKIIYICSPCRNTTNNMQYTKERCNELIQLGYVPIAPHIFYAPFLSNQIPDERALEKEIALELLKKCDFIHVYGNEITLEMQAEIELAASLGIPIKYDGVPWL